MNEIAVFSPGETVRSLAGALSLPVIERTPYGTWLVGGDLLDASSLTHAVPPEWFWKAQECLRQATPTLTRWVDPHHSFELILRQLTFESLVLAEAIQARGIVSVLFHTSSSHHIDSLVCETACILIGVPQVHLYFESITRRLLPLRQSFGVSDRHPLGALISTYVADQDIDAISLQATRVRQNPLLHPVEARSVAWAQVLSQAMRRSMRSWFWRTSRVEVLERTRVGEQLSVVNRQVAARTELQSLIISQRIYATRLLQGATTEKPLVVLFAHLQPEAATYPEGGALNNHVDLVVALRANGYSEPILYREHPRMWLLSERGWMSRGGLFRSRHFYRLLLSLGVVFIDPGECPAFSPTILPLTMTGSIAVERALCGLPSVVSGYPWYGTLPGVMPLRLLKSGESARQEIDPNLSGGDAARQRLATLLNGHTLVNFPGIGSGERLYDSKRHAEFVEEFENLIEALVQH